MSQHKNQLSRIPYFQSPESKYNYPSFPKASLVYIEESQFLGRNRLEKDKGKDLRHATVFKRIRKVIA